jgi:hypothetical protein
MTNKHISRHIRISAFAAALAVGGIVLVNRVAQASTLAANVETVDIDLGQATTQVASSTPVDGQFPFLAGLAVLGLLGIMVIVRDVRRGRV